MIHSKVWKMLSPHAFSPCCHNFSTTEINYFKNLQKVRCGALTQLYKSESWPFKQLKPGFHMIWKSLRRLRSRSETICIGRSQTVADTTDMCFHLYNVSTITYSAFKFLGANYSNNMAEVIRRWFLSCQLALLVKPGSHMSGKSLTIGDLGVSPSSPIFATDTGIDRENRNRF